MELFSWDETAFIECLGVLPRETNEFGRNLDFEVASSSVTLYFGVNVDTSDCSVILHRGDVNVPFFRAVYLGSPGARFQRRLISGVRYH
jgi:hypothetical protein